MSLRSFSEADAELLFRQWNDPEVRRYLFDDEPVSREMVAQQIRASSDNFRSRGYGFFTVAPLEAPGDVIGFAGLRPFGEPERVEILYALLPGRWGRGLATEASRAVLRFGFHDAALAEIFAGADPPNAASFRVMERLGMRFFADMVMGGRPARYYRLGRDEYLRPDPAGSAP